MVANPASISASATEVAYVAGLSETEVHRLVDGSVLPETLIDRQSGRRFALIVAPMTRFFADSSAHLTRTARAEVMRAIAVRATTSQEANGLLNLESAPATLDWGVTLGAITVAFQPYYQRAQVRARRLREAVSYISENPEIQCGVACFNGTRLPVASVLAARNGGFSVDQLMETWPYLTPDLIGLGEVYLAARPRQGRPTRRVKDIFPDAELVSSIVIRPRPKSGA